MGMVALFLAYTGLQMFVPIRIGDASVEVEIPEGTTFSQAMNILTKHNLMRDKNVFIALAKITRLERKIRAGFYPFSGLMSPFEIFLRLKNGKIIEYDVTVVEGDSLLEIGRKLSEKKIVSLDQFDDLTKDRAFLTSLAVNAPSLEGYLYPQTYKIPKGKPGHSVLKLMVQKLREEYTGALKERAEEIGWDENQVLTLASIIEKEAVNDEERPLISAVYHNRVRLGMPLQADPTAIYGVKSSRDKITKDDLKKQTKYNTYIIKGLPPGPIASPGIKSIRAALYPADVPYLYFVSRGDGSHYFSRTLSEHAAATRKLRNIQRSDNSEKS